jgi:uncharacterized BrkB/YihY/UPF0761 family membrane protein
MLWFYFSGVTILIGAELNGVVEQRIHSAADDAAPQ